MRMYHKIPNVFYRDMEGTKQLDLTKYSTPEITALAHIQWEGTEKIDGTNVRVAWDGHTVTFAGRTDRAQFRAHLEHYLHETFLTPEVEEIFEQHYGDREVILFGEGYGQKIQEPYGSGYLPDSVAFRAFDLLVGGTWATRGHMEAFATALGVDTCPLVFTGTLPEAKTMLLEDAHTRVGTVSDYMEGIVLRPAIELLDRHRERIICKMKTRDLVKEDA